MNFPERRRLDRFRGGISVELENGTGTARDFSASGICFETDQAFFPGEPIEFVMLLENLFLGELVRVRCWGKILRVEPNGEKTAVAAVIDLHKFEGTETPVVEEPAYTSGERSSVVQKRGEKGATPAILP